MEALVGEWNPSSLALGWGTFEAQLTSQVPYENRLLLPSPWLAWYQTQTGFILFHVLLPLRPHWFLCKNFYLFIYFLNFGCTVFITAQDFSICSEQGLLCNCSALAFQSCASPDVDQSLGHSGSVVLAHRVSCPGAFAICTNQVLNTGSEGKALWKEFEINHFYMKLGTMAYLWGDWERIVLASSNLLRSELIEVPLPRVPTGSWSCPSMWLCSCFSFWIPH